MARLNEPPAAPAAGIATTGAGESIDACESARPNFSTACERNTMRTKSRPVIEKAPANFEEVRRRFIRQNRDLAKNNSSQSLKIRSLELEVSRLLADNLELRNQALRLQHEVDLGNRRAGGRFKAELRERIEALMGIVDGMDDGERQDAAEEAKEKKPLEGNWRERQPLSELMRDSQMPTIQEDKQYPRRTLGADEIQAIRLSDDSSNESPDLGPPPVARFDYDSAGDPVKQPSPLSNKVSLPPPTANGEDEDDMPASTVNLESRRKRKDGQPKIEIRRRSLMPPESPDKDSEQPSAILRTGAKRKLADREAERPIKPPSKGDFTFSRKVNGEDVKPTAVTEQPSDIEAQLLLDEKPARKVLGDKSVNMSPRKTAAPPVGEKPEKEKPIKPAASRFQPRAKDKEKDAAPARRRRQSAIPLPSPKAEEPEIIETVEIPPPLELAPGTTDIQPNTPAPPDLFSPTPSEPSARPEGGRSGTPPPGDLSTMSIATDGGTRPSRRARGAVNYAEPSLNAKMRRPGKQMVDAISGLQHHSRAMSARESEPRSIIKAEPVDEEEAEKAWRHLPPPHLSPLSQRSTDAEAVEEAERPSLPAPSLSRKRLPAVTKRSASASSSGDLEAAVRKMEELDIHEFRESSSPLTDGSAASVGKVPGKSHRRHSSVPKAVETAQVPKGVVVGAGDCGRTEVKGSARAASRRRSMML